MGGTEQAGKLKGLVAYQPPMHIFLVEVSILREREEEIAFIYNAIKKQNKKEPFILTIVENVISESNEDNQEKYLSFLHYTGINNDYEKDHAIYSFGKNEPTTVSYSKYHEVTKKFPKPKLVSKQLINNLPNIGRLSAYRQDELQNLKYIEINMLEWFYFCYSIAPNIDKFNDAIKSLATITLMNDQFPSEFSDQEIVLGNYIPLDKIKGDPFSEKYTHVRQIIHDILQKNRGRSYFFSQMIGVEKNIFHFPNLSEIKHIKIIGFNVQIKNLYFENIQAINADVLIMENIQANRIDLNKVKYLYADSINIDEKMIERGDFTHLDIIGSDYIRFDDYNFNYIAVKPNHKDLETKVNEPIKQIIFENINVKKSRWGYSFVIENTDIEYMYIVDKYKLEYSFKFTKVNVIDELIVSAKINNFYIKDTKFPQTTNFNGSDLKIDAQTASVMKTMMSELKNHNEEERFAKREFILKRDSDSINKSDRIFHVLYEKLFDCGYSILSPIMWLIGLWFVCSIEISGQALSILFLFDWTIKDFLTEAIPLAFSYIDFNFSDSFTHNTPFALLGSYSTPNEGGQKLQSLLATGLWFMLLLAFRNNFKIRW